LKEIVNPEKWFSKKMRLFRDNFVANWHEHVSHSNFSEIRWERLDYLVNFCKENGIDKTMVSAIDTVSDVCSPEVFQRLNGFVAQAVKKHPDILRGMIFVDMAFPKEAEYEIRKRVNEGFIGIKLYHQHLINDPQMYSLYKLCRELDIPVLMHAGHNTYPDPRQPRMSGGEHFADIALEFPDVQFIMAHITGGGDWYWQLKAIKDSPNIVIDMSGSVLDKPVIETAVKMLGADRILFGTDGSPAACVGKILGAEISDEDKKTILSGTAFRRYIERSNVKC
jgi:predicted TIM-barrel fold metal-dependent hydrolase